MTKNIIAVLIIALCIPLQTLAKDQTKVRSFMNFIVIDDELALKKKYILKVEQDNDDVIIYVIAFRYGQTYKIKNVSLSTVLRTIN